MSTSSIVREILPMIPAILFWVGIPAYIFYRRRHPVQRTRAQRIVMRCIGILLIGFLLFMFASLAMGIYRSTVQNRVRNANSNAKDIAWEFEYTATELELPEHSELEYTFCNGTAEPPCPVLEELKSRKNWWFRDTCCVIVTDGNWHVLRVWWSSSPLTPDKLYSYEKEKQIDYMMSPFTDHDALVGYYEASPPEDAEETS